MNNEHAVINSIERDGLYIFQAQGTLDINGQLVRVPVHNEHRRGIDSAGYNVTWDKPEVRIEGDDIPVRFVNTPDGQRIGDVLKLGTVNDWIKIRQR